MMRITELSRSESVVRLRLEGRLTQSTTPEMRAAVQSCLTAGRTVLVDLAGVTFADPGGVETLLALCRAGVVLVACSPFLAEMLRVDASRERRHPETVTRDTGAAEASLLARLHDGDEAAFAELVDRHAGRMLAVAMRLLRNEDEARDAVQDAFLSAFKHVAGFNGDAKLSTWLHRITVNAALMRLRSRKRRGERSIDDLLPCFDDTGGWARELGRPAASSQELLERRETRVVVRRCIDQLPGTYRTILLMRDIEELDTHEAAELLGITPNAVKIRLHRARQALRTLIDRELERTDVPAVRADRSAAGSRDASL